MDICRSVTSWYGTQLLCIPKQWKSVKGEGRSFFSQRLCWWKFMSHCAVLLACLNNVRQLISRFFQLFLQIGMFEARRNREKDILELTLSIIEKKVELLLTATTLDYLYTQFYGFKEIKKAHPHHTLLYFSVCLPPLTFLKAQLSYLFTVLQ